MMSLPSGTRLGPYEIVEPLGHGGMGEVYKAHDTRLDRTVAIKILLQHAAGDGNRRQRFEREAKTLAALSHPHICPIFDVGESVPAARPSPIQGEEARGAAGTTPVHYLVMEYLQGETLGARLARGALPIADALRCGVQIAHALDAAHRSGITHRDLKPGNIMLTASGAKLVDFGLASLCAPVIEARATSSLATATGPLTARGTILGTLHYMAPEQLEGKPADARSDLFAFGAVLHEMVTGRQAFEGDSPASLIGAIMSSEPPPVSSVASLSPAALDHLVTTCLAKDPDHRWQSAADVRLQLLWIAAAGDPPIGRQPAGSAVARAAAWRWSAVALAVALVGSWMLPVFRTGGPDGGRAGVAPAVTRYVVNLSGDQQLAQQMSIFTPSLALSRDGRRLIHVGMAPGGGTRLYVRSFDEFEAAPLPGTEGAYAPSFSPEGAWVVFFQEGELRRVSIAGGRPVTICAASSQGLGADWLDDDTIVFSPGIGSGLMRVPASGGTPEVVTVPDAASGEVSHVYPQALPNGRDILFGVQTPSAFHTAVLSVETRAWRRLADGRSPRYVPTGHLVFARGDTLWAAPFDADTGVLRGDPQPVIDGIRPISIAGGDYAVSQSGLLVYVPGRRANPRTELGWVDRSGRRTPLPAEPATYATPRLSPDGAQLAFAVYSPAGDGSSLWVSDWRSGRRTRLSVEGNVQLYPVWAADGTRLTFTTARPDGRLHWKRVDGGGDAERLVKSSTPQIAGMWSPDGAVLVYVNVHPRTREESGQCRSAGSRRPSFGRPLARPPRRSRRTGAGLRTPRTTPGVMKCTSCDTPSWIAARWSRPAEGASRCGPREPESCSTWTSGIGSSPCPWPPADQPVWHSCSSRLRRSRIDSSRAPTTCRPTASDSFWPSRPRRSSSTGFTWSRTGSRN